ncbi:protein phosphatase 1 regulatory subunit 1B-like [Lampris incognitus]|uniref:protein phosphatase 1 regulatory subunit 1B-like n=1 Tax=Lampris incognitus TaxID=2546036 RepID=UPI0024B49FFA|nr:protein phosphatase 1 regulatory subunit 1B-like [Lampris incognitus]
MDPLLPADAEAMEREAAKERRRRIQFSVPSAIPTLLDPRQVEMIRRRRPTPATLFRLTDPPSPEEDTGAHQWVRGENAPLKAKLVNTAVYQPPSLKAVQRMAQAHLQSMDLGSCGSMEKEELSSGEEEDEVVEENHKTATATRSKLNSTGSAVLSCHAGDEGKAEESEEGKEE